MPRGALVVFRRPGYPSQKLAKRIVAVTGDRVSVDKADKPGQCRIGVNGAFIQSATGERREFRCSRTRVLGSYSGDSEPSFVVPTNALMVLGEDVGSLDSIDFGLIPYSAVVGVVISGLWPSFSTTIR
jgi:signal peptidase I